MGPHSVKTSINSKKLFQGIDKEKEIVSMNLSYGKNRKNKAYSQL
jgi:hypothetical protein